MIRPVPSIQVPPTNREYRLFYFVRPDGRGQLADGETIQSATVAAAYADTGESVSGLIDEVAPYGNTAIRYFVDAPAGGILPDDVVILTISAVTSLGQTLTEQLDLAFSHR